MSRSLCRITVSAGLATIASIGLAATVANPAIAATRCVGDKPPCLSSLQAAVDAARDGDTIKIRGGRFAGGVTVTKSLHIVGAGARRTVINGGGPVLTIGTPGVANAALVVSIAGVRITGGVSEGNVEPFVGVGGGIFIPASGRRGDPASGLTAGATVTITNSVIARNRAAATESVPSGLPCGDACPYSVGAGGGIDNDGDLTLTDTVVSDNEAGPAAGVTSDAEAAGIRSHEEGSLRLVHSVVTRNHTRAAAPFGRFADAGGIYASGGTITIADSAITRNSAALAASMPDEVELAAQSGGIHLGGPSIAVITDTHISGNAVTASNPAGARFAYAGALGLDNEATLEMRDSVVRGNSVHSTAGTAPAEPGLFLAASGGLDLSGKAVISDTEFIGNSAEGFASNGATFVTGGALSTVSAPGVTISDSVIRDNHVTAVSRNGVTLATGGGLANSGVLDMRRSTVAHNTISAAGTNVVARGGGVYNGAVPDPTVEAPVELTLENVRIVGNRLIAPAANTVQGGGLFTQFPAALTNVLITGNSPDQCVGC